jgi:hypothetical protein
MIIMIMIRKVARRGVLLVVVVVLVLTVDDMPLDMLYDETIWKRRELR